LEATGGVPFAGECGYSSELLATLRRLGRLLGGCPRGYALHAFFSFFLFFEEFAFAGDVARRLGQDVFADGLMVSRAMMRLRWRLAGFK